MTYPTSDSDRPVSRRGRGPRWRRSAPAGSRAEVAMLKKIASRVERQRGRDRHRGVRPGAVRRVAARPAHLLSSSCAKSVAARLRRQLQRRSAASGGRGEGRDGAGGDGASVARIRMTLAQPMRPRVRSARNMIYVEADRLDRVPTSGGVDQHGRPGERDSRRARRAPRRRDGGHAARHRPAGRDERERAQGRPAAARHRSAERDVGAAGDDAGRRRDRSARAHRHQPQGAARHPGR